MARIVFYEKPGCINNTRQKRLLIAAGALLDVRNLLTEGWTASRLAGFFQHKPVAEWFNKAAPGVKSGIINPAAISADDALVAMLQDPLLIRRPLIQYGDFHCSGFDWPALAAQLDLQAEAESLPDLESCPRQASTTACTNEEAQS